MEFRRRRRLAVSLEYRRVTAGRDYARQNRWASGQNATGQSATIGQNSTRTKCHKRVNNRLQD